MTPIRILLVNLDGETIQDVERALPGQAYEITADHSSKVEQIVTLSPDVLITEVSPADLGNCGLISKIKAGSGLRTPRAVLIVHGGALERARALDLGADDVVSSPFDPVEFAAKIRTQFREMQPELELGAKLKEALQREHLAEIAVEALSEGGNSKRRFWLGLAILGLGAATFLAALAAAISNGRERKDTLQLKAEIARLNGGILQQGKLPRRSEQAPEFPQAESNSKPATHESLKAQTENPRKNVAADGDADAKAFKQQLQETQTRLQRLEHEGRAAETIVQTYGPSVCLLHVLVRFREKSSGQPIRIAVDSTGKPRVDGKGMLSWEIGGTGPPLELDFLGTGFLVRRDGRILTNRHVAEPWSDDEKLKELGDVSVTAYALSYTAYFPGNSQGITAKLGRVSSHADLATLTLQTAAPLRTAPLELDDRSEASVAGDPVVLIGYPAGVDGILARAGRDVTRAVAENASETTEILSRLASQHLIRPTTTQGHIGDVLHDAIVYDAATTRGGSGGPLFNRSGKVIGVNFAVLNDFGGSNLAIPARYAAELVK